MKQLSYFDIEYDEIYKCYRIFEYSIRGSTLHKQYRGNATTKQAKEYFQRIQNK
ncbi:TPA: hypothetical protein KQH10_003752 [Clostridioides difficile]|mgnify:FL=1|uniref:hypothetical protein n=1 Tax=Clostridioides difficile TaxID=1496 RepID=UPI00097FDB53|nr:hypothetical protein [Clostridioides difficile]AXU61313.1 hypothetical protein CDIF28666_02275 [Clostridioides difficile]MBT2158850.1 hypothetical protein [Clostridioides difficile]MCJ0326433.1 hypothetical protein [Clostridioides difficile]MCJ0368607.1 hypothetical protein [Clostridioides difficile]MCJ0380321.1 hypothetical protein [Clostridioides difficile]